MKEGDTLNLPRAFWPTYYAIAGVPAVFTLAIGTFAAGPLHVDDMLATVVLGLGVFNIFGIGWHARHLRVSRQVSNGLARSIEELRKVPTGGALWMFLVVAGFLGGHHALSHSGFGWTRTSELAYPFGLIGLYAALMSVFHYFAVGALVASVRCESDQASHGSSTPSSHLRIRLLAAVTTIAFVPLALVLMHREVSASMPPHHVPDIEMFLALDLAAAALILAAAFAFFTQTVTRPIEILLAAMGRLRMGALDTRAGMATDDEIGSLALGFNAMAEELEERAFLQESLGRFVPEAVANAVRADRGVVLPREAEATIVYSDIAGFTRLCQRLAPEVVFPLLNEYFGALAICIQSRGGVITQYQGDAMLATFNLPLADDDHALNAVRAALDIQRCVDTRRFGGDTSLPTRLGISTGRVVAGTVGGGAQLGYTVHGDAVNLAQRLEQANKQSGTRLLLSARTAELIDGRIPLQAHGAMTLPGRDGTVSVYTVSGAHESAQTPELPIACSRPGPGHTGSCKMDLYEDATRAASST